MIAGGILKPVVRLVCAALLALVIVGCGGAPPGDAPPAGLPRVTVDDVSGGKVDLSSLTPADKPLLVWAWSPI